MLHPSEMVLLEQKFLILNMPSENAWVGADRRRRLSVRAAGQTISPEVDIRGYPRPHSTVTPTIRQNTKEEETILTVTLFLREGIQKKWKFLMTFANKKKRAVSSSIRFLSNIVLLIDIFF